MRLYVSLEAVKVGVLMKPEVEFSPKSVSRAKILTKAFIRAGDKLSLSSAVLAAIVGLSGPTITRMRRGTYTLGEAAKPFELATLFVRTYRSLDAIVGGDDAVAAKWLRASNTILKDKPINLIQKVAGLNNVLQYLDSRRALS